MNLKGYFLVLTLSLVVFAADFDINSTSTCTKSNDQGFCTEWVQKGSVIQRDEGCFSADT